MSILVTKITLRLQVWDAIKGNLGDIPWSYGQHTQSVGILDTISVVFRLS